MSGNPRTWDQAEKWLGIPTEKKATTDHVQRVIGSGIVSDLFDADLTRVERDAVRAVLGLPPINAKPEPISPVLAQVQSGLIVPAHESFDAEGFFLRNRKFKTYDRGNNFTRLVTGRVEQNVPAGTLTKQRTTCYVSGVDLVVEIGEGHDTFFADIAAKIDTMEKDGRWHVFPMTINGERWLVYFYCLGDFYRQGWLFYANRPGDHDFREGSQVFLRDSVPVPLAA